MYVCICKAVTDGSIRASIEAGNDSLEKLKDDLSVASVCGECTATIEGMLTD